MFVRWSALFASVAFPQCLLLRFFFQTQFYKEECSLCSRMTGRFVAIGIGIVLQAQLLGS